MKRFMVGALTIALSLGAAASVTGEENGELRIENLPSITESVARAGFFGVSGTVTEVSTDARQVVVETTEGRTNVFEFFDNTYFISGNESEIAVGDTISGFYDSAAPMLLIEPPRILMSAVAVNYEGDQDIKVDRFDEDGLSWDGELKLNISDNTEILNYDGTEYEGDLTDKGLVVFYTMTTRSIPPQTSPEKIVVLFERFADVEEVSPEDTAIDNGGSGAIIITDDGATIEVGEGNDIIMIEDLRPEITEIVVEGTIINATTPFYTEDGAIMVPLRAIAEALDYDLAWNEATQSVLIDSGRLSISVGVDKYVNETNDDISLGVAPKNVDGRIYVPLAFFTRVAGLNNSYVFEGQVVIDNSEKVE